MEKSQSTSRSKDKIAVEVKTLKRDNTNELGWINGCVYLFRYVNQTYTQNNSVKTVLWHRMQSELKREREGENKISRILYVPRTIFGRSGEKLNYDWKMMICAKRNRNRFIFLSTAAAAAASLLFRFVFDCCILPKEYQKDAPNLIKCHKRWLHSIWFRFNVLYKAIKYSHFSFNFRIDCTKVLLIILDELSHKIHGHDSEKK